MRHLNQFYTAEKALWEIDFDWQGFEWIDCQDYEQSIISFMRKGKDKDDFIIVICNFTPIVRDMYRIGVPENGAYEELFNSDWEVFGGSGQANSGLIQTENVEWHNRAFSINLRLPPLATIYLKRKS